MSATPERNAALMLALWRTVEEIDNATPGELTATVKYARAIASDFVQPATQRAIWRRLAVVLRASQK